MERIFGLVQARLGSSRLPGKVMLDVAGHPLIWHIFDRLKRVPELQGIILGTTTNSEDDRLVSFAEAEGIAIHREKNSDDIAARLAGAVKQVGATGIFKS